MATFTTRDRRIAEFQRTSDIYVLTEIQGTLNEYFDGRKILGFYGWHTDSEAASNACKKAIKGGAGRTRITTITPDDEIIYTGGAHA
ncbi:MAG TPA: hypothetical protein VNH18_11055 [Bryobacteraceae bacterium]|nr:hypothetical protein [Bryobacteraceae bacterium]